MVSKSKHRLKNYFGLGPKKKLNFRALGISDFSPEIILNPMDDGLSSQILSFGFREPLNCYFLFQFIKIGCFDVVLDVGSNIGYFPLVELASGVPQIIAVEPVPETFMFLQENLKDFDNVKLLNLAVSDRNQSVTMYVANEKNLASVILNRDYLKLVKATIVNKIQVNAWTLKHILDVFCLNDYRILLRMDIEGYEKIIGYNLPKAVKGISVELHSPILGYEDSMKLFCHWIKCGFRCVFLSRELNGLDPLISKIGLHSALKLYELFIKRTYRNPELATVKHFVKLQRENPHLFLLRC